MEELILEYLTDMNTLILLVIIAIFFYLLGKGADMVVDESVSLSLSWGIPKVIVGSTIVSLGTTLPEASVSVMAAINGTSGLSLGNAVGSIIADSALILGLSILIGLVPVRGETMKKQANIQVSAVFLLTISCFFYIASARGTRVSQWMGFVFIILLFMYIIYSIKSTQASVETICSEEGEKKVEKKADNIDVGTREEKSKSNPMKTFIILALGIFLIIASSKILIPSIHIVATRVGIPEAVIGATLVAFGTSLPELITAVTAVRKGHGDLAIGNVIGADILNVLFVVGASASVTPSGLEVPKSFLFVQIPFMLVSVLLIRYAIQKSEKNIAKVFGYILLTLYIGYIALTFVV